MITDKIKNKDFDNYHTNTKPQMHLLRTSTYFIFGGPQGPFFIPFNVFLNLCENNKISLHQLIAHRKELNLIQNSFVYSI